MPNEATNPSNGWDISDLFEAEETPADKAIRRILDKRFWRAQRRATTAQQRRAGRRQQEQWEHELEAQADRAATMHFDFPMTGRFEDEERYYNPAAYANDLFDIERERMARELAQTEEI